MRILLTLLIVYFLSGCAYGYMAIQKTEPRTFSTIEDVDTVYSMISIGVHRCWVGSTLNNFLVYSSLDETNATITLHEKNKQGIYLAHDLVEINIQAEGDGTRVFILTRYRIEATTLDVQTWTVGETDICDGSFNPLPQLMP